MSRYPSATWKPITGTSRSTVQKDLLCIHTMVGYLTSTWAYFNRTDVGVYSHIGIGGIWGTDAGKGLDGVAWQMADTDYRAAANLDGNWRIISVETADNAARPIEPWTDRQCDTLVRVMVDAHRLDGIPLVLVPDSKQGRRGVCYHRLGCDPYRVAGGELWSSSYGKDCPTDARIRQLPGLVERARRIAAGEEEDPLMAFSREDLVAIVREGVGAELTTVGDESRTALMDLAQRGATSATSSIRAALQAVRADQGVSGQRETDTLYKLDEALKVLESTEPEPLDPSRQASASSGTASAGSEA